MPDPDQVVTEEGRETRGSVRTWPTEYQLKTLRRQRICKEEHLVGHGYCLVIRLQGFRSYTCSSYNVSVDGIHADLTVNSVRRTAFQ